MQHFEALTDDELALLEDAPALITVLIGAADGELDREERTWSERLLRSRTYNRPSELNTYYTHVAEQFWVKIHAFMTEMPLVVADRNARIEGKLREINPILVKLDAKIAYGLYKGFRSLAEETAKSSGGFLRLGAIGDAEMKWVQLPMIEPIAPPADMPAEAWEEEDSAR